MFQCPNADTTLTIKLYRLRYLQACVNIEVESFVTFGFVSCASDFPSATVLQLARSGPRSDLLSTIKWAPTFKRTGGTARNGEELNFTVYLRFRYNDRSGSFLDSRHMVGGSVDPR